MPCLFKWVWGLPCPACGSTRAVIVLLHGRIFEAFTINPFGPALSALAALAFLAALRDLLLKTNTLFRVYTAIEIQLRRKRVFTPVITLIAFNWIWNLWKGL